MGWWRSISVKDWGCIGLILAVALPLHLIGIAWGMPDNQFGDEWAILNSTLMLPFRHGDPRLYFYGVPYMYLYALLIGGVFVAQSLSGAVSSVEDFAVAFLRDPTTLVLAGRALSAILATASALLLYALSRRFLKPAWSLGAVLITITGGTWVSYAHFAKADHLLVFLFLAVTWLLITAQGSRGRLVIAMALAGAAVACKLPAVALAAPILVALVHDLGGWQAAIRRPLFWTSPLIALLGFAVVNPWSMVHIRDLLSGLSVVGTLYGQDAARYTLSDNVGYYFGVLVGALGPVGVALALASLGLWWFSRGRDRGIVVASAWSLIPLVLTLSHRDVHWLMPAFPLMALASFLMLQQLVERLASKWQHAVLVVVLMIALLPAGIGRTQQLAHLTLPFTTDAAKAFIESTIPPGSGIVMDTGRYLPVNAPALRQDPRRVLEMAVDDARVGTDYAAGGDASHYFRLLARANEGMTTYRIFPILHGIPWKTSTLHERNTLKSLDEYRSLGVRYIVTSSAYAQRYPPLEPHLDDCHPFVADYVRFYRDLLPTLPVMARFEPVSGKLRGPTITVYRLDGAAP